MSLKGHIYLKCLEFRCDIKSGQHNTRKGTTFFTEEYLQSKICLCLMHHALLCEHQFVGVQQSEPLLHQAEKYPSCFWENGTWLPVDKESDRRQLTGDGEGHAVVSCSKPGVRTTHHSHQEKVSFYNL